MLPVIESVPNFSEGRDPSFVAAVVDAFGSTGSDVLHYTADPDHHRSVVTVIGSPDVVEEGAVRAAEVARDRIDLRLHRGVHPRVGALDVLPFVPIHGLDMADAVTSARRVGRRIAGMGVPVFLYGRAADPPGRGLASIRRGGFEALVSRSDPADGAADLPGLDRAGSARHRFAHPSAGATCVGARNVLLAWNVDVEGISLEEARGMASRLRESGGGFEGLRALAFALPSQQRLQISMNLEDPVSTAPLDVFQAIESEVLRLQGQVVETEIIGMIPETLSAPSALRSIGVRSWEERRFLGRRLAGHLAVRRAEVNEY